MDKLNNFLSITSKKNIKPIKVCCDNEENIIFDGIFGYSVCIICSKVINKTKEVPVFCENIDFVTKSVIPYHPKFKHLYRLQKWTNYSYREVSDRKLIDFIETLPIENREIRNLSKIIFITEYSKISVRSNIRNGIIVYSIYKSHLIFNKNIDIDKLFLMLKINYKHYNSSVKKIKTDKIVYPKDINIYLKKIDNIIDKNYLIRVYNDFIEIIHKFNSKSAILGLIYHILDKRELLCVKKFYKDFDISTNSINNIINEIKKINILID